jgi:hypothetical protein
METKKTYFAVIRVPQQTKPEVHFNLEDDRRRIEDIIDWDIAIKEELEFLRDLWENDSANDGIPFSMLESDITEIRYCEGSYKKGDIVYDSFWDDGSIITFDSEVEFLEYYFILINRKPHQWIGMIRLIKNYILSEYGFDINIIDTTDINDDIINTLIKKIKDKDKNIW